MLIDFIREQEAELAANSSSYRTLPLVAPIKVLLEKKKKGICEYRNLFKNGYCNKDSDYVCVNEIGELIRPRTLFQRQTRWRIYCTVTADGYV